MYNDKIVDLNQRKDETRRIFKNEFPSEFDSLSLLRRTDARGSAYTICLIWPISQLRSSRTIIDVTIRSCVEYLTSSDNILLLVQSNVVEKSGLIDGFSIRFNDNREVAYFLGSPSISNVVYRVPATGTRSPRIAYRQSLWLADVAHHWAAGDGVDLQPNRRQKSQWRRRSSD